MNSSYFQILEFSNFEIFRENIFCFGQEHIEKMKISKIKIYVLLLIILNRYVSNLQVPTTSGARWGKVNVSENPENARFFEKLQSVILGIFNKRDIFLPPARLDETRSRRSGGVVWSTAALEVVPWTC